MRLCPAYPCNVRKLECIVCASDPIGEEILEALSIVSELAIEGEVGGFIGVFVEVVHQPGLTFEYGIFPTVVGDHTAPRAFSVGGKTAAVSRIDNL
jgi:hypothetical protein